MSRRSFLALFSFLTPCFLVVSSILPSLTDSAAKANEAVMAPFVPPGVDPSLAIDLFIDAAWRQQQVTPRDLCEDNVFVRRLYLDLVGRVPTRDETDSFLRETSSDKRNRLIDRLLESDEHASHMADVFDAYLMGRRGPRVLDQREEHGWRDYLRDAFAANRPWNQMARDMVLARATDQTDVRGGWFLYERKDRHQQIAESVAASFFGIRIECAQCHDHPLASEIQQDHYWGLVAFFNRSKNTSHHRVAESAVGGFSQYTDLAGDSYDSRLTFFESPVIDEPRPDGDDEPQDSDENYIPATLDRSKEPKVPKFSRRQKFADEILADHHLLAVAFVNRMWGLFLGRGIVHPVDEIDSMHDPSHRELLDWLAEDFRRSDYDIRRLIRHLVRSRCYQLDGRSPTSNAGPQHFAYALDKPLTAESLLRSIYVVLHGHANDVDGELMVQFRDKFPDVFVETHSSTLSQALLLTNHPAINLLFHDDENNLVGRLANISDSAAQVETAFRIVMHRRPSDDELQQSVRFLNEHHDRHDGLAQFLWALVMSAEFRVNH